VAGEAATGGPGGAFLEYSKWLLNKTQTSSVPLEGTWDFPRQPGWDVPEIVAAEITRIEELPATPRKGFGGKVIGAISEVYRDKVLAELEARYEELDGGDLENPDGPYGYQNEAEIQSQYDYGEPDDAESRRIAVETAPYAVERYRSEFMPTTTKVPRKLPDPPNRMPTGRKVGAAGASGAIVGGIIELIKFGRDYFETEEQRNKSKGPSSRPKAKAKKEPAPDEIRVAIERRVEPVVTAPAKVENRAEQRRREEIGKIEEITVTKQRRALPPSSQPGTTLPPLPKVPKPIVIDPLRLLDLISSRKGQAKSSTKGPKTERESRDQVSFNPAQSKPRVETKERTKCEESRTRCYKGFYRERSKSTAKKKWTEIDCFSGKEINRG